MDWTFYSQNLIQSGLALKTFFYSPDHLSNNYYKNTGTLCLRLLYDWCKQLEIWINLTHKSHQLSIKLGWWFWWLFFNLLLGRNNTRVALVPRYRLLNLRLISRTSSTNFLFHPSTRRLLLWFACWSSRILLSWFWRDVSNWNQCNFLLD